MRKVNKKGFTLIELLAVIIILGLLMAIAIPSVTRYIDQSRKKTLVSTIGNYISAATIAMNNGDYTFTNHSNYETGTLYAVELNCVDLEKGGSNPYGTWGEGSYVLIRYVEDKGYNYGFQFKDSSNHFMTARLHNQINQAAIEQGTNTIGNDTAITLDGTTYATGNIARLSCSTP